MAHFPRELSTHDKEGGEWTAWQTNKSQASTLPFSGKLVGCPNSGKIEGHAVMT